MRALVNHILAVADQQGLKITNLQLQKVLYFSLIEIIRNKILSEEEINDLYNQPFLVWRYGPVVEDIYDEYKPYGSTAILEKGERAPELERLNDFIVDLLGEPPFHLVEISHSHSKWEKNEDKILYGRSNIPYTLDDLILEANNEQARI